MAIDDEPRALGADVLSQIISDIKQSRPTRSMAHPRPDTSTAN
jgi:hypothetical protein